jgi:Major capsid protein GP7
MATVQNNYLGILEIAKRTNNGVVLSISEVLSRVDEILMDIPYVPCNQVSAYVHTRRRSLPTGTWRTIGTGASIEVSHTKQIVENVGTVESWAEVDELTLKKMIGDKQAFLNSEFTGFVEGLGQTITTALVSADTQLNPEQFDGLQIRLNALGTYVLGCGGAGGDTTSIYGVQWGQNRVHGIYEPGIAMPGVNAPVGVDYKGLKTVEDGSSGSTATRRDVYQAKFQASLGLCCWDDRNLIRLTNIEHDPSGANIFEPDLLISLMRLGKKGQGIGGEQTYGITPFPEWMLYCNHNVLTQLDILAMDKSNVLYTIGELWGEPVDMFRRAPLRQLDAIGQTETAVS